MGCVLVDRESVLVDEKSLVGCVLVDREGLVGREDHDLVDGEGLGGWKDHGVGGRKDRGP